MIVVLKTLCIWLGNSVNSPYSEESVQYQGDICGCLTILINRLGSQIESLGLADQLFRLFLKVIEIGLISGNASATGSPVNGITTLNDLPPATNPLASGSKGGSEDEAVIAMGTLIRATPKAFHKNITELTQVLLEGLRRPSNIGVRKMKEVKK